MSEQRVGGGVCVCVCVCSGLAGGGNCPALHGTALGF